MAAESGSDNPLDQLRLSLMQEVLPVGLAVVERARQGGPSKVVEALHDRRQPIRWQICARRENRRPAAFATNSMPSVPVWAIPSCPWRCRWKNLRMSGRSCW